MNQEKKYCVYMHKFPNGKKYIGISSNAKKRWRNGKGYETQGKIANAIDCFGWDNIEHVVIIDGLEKLQAERLEEFLITELDTIENGYNTAIGGNNINSSYLNEHVLKMIRESRKYDKIYGFQEPDDGIVKTAELGKTNPRYAKYFNWIDSRIETEFNEYKSFYSTNPLADLEAWSVDCYWWTFSEIMQHGKPQKSYIQAVYEYESATRK